MKKLLAIITVTAITAVAGTAMALDTNELTVSASVTGTCKFSSPTSTLSFGNIDPAGTTDVTGQATVVYWCTKGVTHTIATDNGDYPSGTTKRMQHATDTSAYLPYKLDLTVPAAALNNGPDDPQDLTIDGTVTSAAYRTALAGSYQDIVEINITP